MTRAPLDVLELLAKKRDADNKKPTFLSHAERAEQRAAIALQKRAEMVEARRNGSLKREAFDHEDRGRSDKHSSGKHTSSSATVEKKKRRVNDVRKFTFDWDAQDDTSDITDPLYASKHNSYSHNGRHVDHAIQTHKNDRLSEPHVSRSSGLQSDSARKDEDQHWTTKSRLQMKERDWRIFKEDFNIQVKGSACPNPIRSWEEAEFPPSIMSVIKSVGYNEPTPIQKATIPIALQARDIIGVAETGSGKTASFVLPMLVHISTLPPLTNLNKNDGPYAMVLAPTRELAQQIEIETRKFATALDLKVVSIVGGHSIEEQSFNLRDGAQIVIATPGRLLDCLERHVLVLAQCAYVVMDEADRMVDLGFEEAVNQLLDALPSHNRKPDDDSMSIDEHSSSQFKYRQTIMFSATMPSAVEKLARKYLKRPATVIIGNAGQAVDTVEQRLEVINGEEKRKKRMGEILNGGEFDRPVIVFVNTKRNCDTLAKFLITLGWTTATLHGGKTQDQREAALRNLRAGDADVLVATDLAGRGIDVPDVSLVLNFNMSKTIEDYVHRIGRTGRAGKKGVAITFLGDDEEESKKAITALIRKQERQPAISHTFY